MNLLSKLTGKYRFLTYRGSRSTYLLLSAINNLYGSVFTLANSVIVPTRYGRLILPKRGYAQNRALQFMLDAVEPQVASEFMNAVKSAGVFIDVGSAADGWYTLKACKANPNILVVSIEPLSAEYKYLLMNIKNNCPKRVIPLRLALGDVEGVIDMNGEPVKITTLDTLAAKLNLHSVDLLKLDVEGAGAQIIEGGIKTIMKYKPIIFYEIHNEAEARSLKALVRLGYRVELKPGLMAIATPGKT